MDFDAVSCLPKRDRNSAIGDRGLAEFQHAVPAGLFLYRPEPTADYGADASMEALVDGRATGFRVYVQSKATELGTRLKDGTYTRRIKPSNVQYLLNHSHNSLYVHWVEGSNQLLYAMARDYLKAAFGATSGEITVHFRHPLDESAFQTIHREVVRAGTRIARLSYCQAVCSQQDYAVVDFSDGEVTTRSEMEARYVKDGIRLAMSAPVLFDRLASKFGLADSKEVRVQLAIALGATIRAETGKAQEAIKWVRLLEGRSLTESEAAILGYCQSTTDYIAGNLKDAEYCDNLTSISSKVAGADGEFLKQAIALWLALRVCNGPPNISAMQLALDEAITANDRSSSLAAHQIRLNGAKCAESMLNAAMFLRIGRSWGDPRRLRAGDTQLTAALNDFMSLLNVLQKFLRQQPSKKQNPWMHVRSKIEALCGIVLVARAWPQVAALGKVKHDLLKLSSLLLSVVRVADVGAKEFREVSLFSDQMWALCAAAEIYALAGHSEKSRERAQKVQRLSEVTGIHLFDDWVRDLLNPPIPMSERFSDWHNARSTDDELRNHAVWLSEESGQPFELSLVSAHVDRLESQIRIAHCIHFELADQPSPVVRFGRGSRIWLGHCRKLKRRGFGCSQFAEAAESFVRGNCSGCAEVSPAPYPGPEYEKQWGL